jgi:hypothetical protein
MTELTAAHLRARLLYNPEDGSFALRQWLRTTG